MASLTVRWPSLPRPNTATCSSRRPPAGARRAALRCVVAAARRCEARHEQRADGHLGAISRRPALLLALALTTATAGTRPALAEEGAPAPSEEAALAAEAAGDWKGAAELWLALTNQAEGPGRRDKQTGARLRFRYALCLLQAGEKASAVKALEVSARVLRGSDVRGALAAALWSAGEGEKAEAFWQAAVDQGGTGVLTEEYTRDVLLWPPAAVDALVKFRAAETPPAPDAEAAEDLARFEKARETKEFFREKLGPVNGLEGAIFGSK